MGNVPDPPIMYVICDAMFAMFHLPVTFRHFNTLSNSIIILTLYFPTRPLSTVISPPYSYIKFASKHSKHPSIPTSTPTIRISSITEIPVHYLLAFTFSPNTQIYYSHTLPDHHPPPTSNTQPLNTHLSHSHIHSMILNLHSHSHSPSNSFTSNIMFTISYISFTLQLHYYPLPPTPSLS